MQLPRFLSGIAAWVVSMILLCGLTACMGRTGKGNVGQMQSFNFSVNEAAWIRQGEPIEFEGEYWYPGDGVENFVDPEVVLTGEYRGVQFFVEKTDVRPFNRLYTKFGRNQFRYFEKK